MDIEEARQMNKQLQTHIMRKILEYEQVTGLRITKAAMEPFSGTRFFNIVVSGHPKDLRV